MSTLYVCAGCRRHVFESEERCPFCGATRARGPRLAAQAGVVAAVLVAGMTGLAACPEPQPEEKKLDPKEATKVTQPTTTTTSTTQPIDTSTVGGGDIPKPAYGVPPQLLYPDAAAPLAGDAGTSDATTDARADGSSDASADAPKEAGPKPMPTPTPTKPPPVPAYGVPPKPPIGPKGGPGDGPF